MSHLFPRPLRPAATLLLFTLALVGLSFAPPAQPALADEPLRFAGDYDARVAQAWMQLLYDRIEVESISAPAASRLYAYAGITLYEAVLNGMPSNNSLAGQIEHMPDMPLPDMELPDMQKNHDWAAVATAALAGVYHGLFEDATPETHAEIDALREQWLREIETRVSPVVLEYSITYGEELAEALLEWIAGDNYAGTRDRDWTLGSWSSSWIPTTAGTTAVEPYWGEMRPFGLEWADECAVPLNTPYDTYPTSAFYQQALEVKQVGDDLTQEQKAIARWWVDTPGQTGTPAGHWVMIENQLVDQLNLSLARAAEMYAMTGIALADSFISCWSLKYQVDLLRPVTYINANIRRSWAPYIETPPFPEYPSGHSVVSAAAADILTSLLGNVAFTDETHVHRGERPRSFTSFEAAAYEASISRLYGGIHYRTAIENGMRQGRCIAAHLLDNIQLNPISQSGE